MVIFFRKLHRLWFLFWLIFFFVLLYPFYYLSSRSSKYYPILNVLRTINCVCSCVLSGIFFSIELETALNKDQTYIYCANHSSNLDIMVLCIIAKGNFHFMGKEELLNSPILGIFFRTIDITVKRDSKISAFRAFKKAEENLEKGMSLIIFPEGGIEEEYPPQLSPFKNGPFRLAIDKSIPLVPISLGNLWQLMWDDGKKHGTRPGICDIYIHAPINTDKLKLEEADDLKEKVFELINSKLNYT
ncbi:1-acyl-sn-glycerol-3-phosphate acyltransferase [Pedobacter sp. UYP30]|uniref:lysophospholipid acyltransferase family protein n=1 Tax=Pedobacter sp. UYP30 TaxID=1756400 RepID=UPI003395C3A3